MYVESDKQAVILPKQLAHDLREVGNHLGEMHEQELEDARVAAVEIFVESYLDQFRDDFVFDGEGHAIHVSRHRD